MASRPTDRKKPRPAATAAKATAKKDAPASKKPAIKMKAAKKAEPVKAEAPLKAKKARSEGKAPAEKKARTRKAKIPPRTRVRWCIYDGGMKQVAFFDYNQLNAAKAKLAELLEKKPNYFLQLFKDLLPVSEEEVKA